MSWAEDMGYDAFDWFDFHGKMKDDWEVVEEEDD